MKRIIPFATIAFLLGGAVYLAIRAGAPDAASSGGPDAAPGRPRRNAQPARPSPVPALIRTLTDPSRRLEEQIEAVRALPSDLSEDETAALAALFRRPAPANARRGRWHVLLNEVMEVLRQPRFGWAGYGETMGGLLADRSADPVVRDYAAQHLAIWLGDGRGAAASAEEFDRAMKTYLAVLAGEGESFEQVAGTSLMALCKLREKRGASDFEPYDAELANLVAAYAGGTLPASLPNRVSAIQAAGRMGLRKALPDIRRYAPAPNPTIRLSSVAALGYFADPEDREFLENLANSNDRLRFAARTALENHARRPSRHRTSPR